MSSMVASNAFMALTCVHDLEWKNLTHFNFTIVTVKGILGEIEKECSPTETTSVPRTAERNLKKRILQTTTSSLCMSELAIGVKEEAVLITSIC